MNEEEARSVLRLLFHDARLAGGASLVEVEAIERELGQVLPPSYRAFLRECGAALFDGGEFAGVLPPGSRGSRDEPPMWSDVMAWYRDLQRPPQPLRPDLVPVADDGQDTTFFLDLSQRQASGECPVVALGPGSDGDVVAPTFLAFAQQTRQNIE